LQSPEATKDEIAVRTTPGSPSPFSWTRPPALLVSGLTEFLIAQELVSTLSRLCRAWYLGFFATLGPRSITWRCLWTRPSHDCDKRGRGAWWNAAQCYRLALALLDACQRRRQLAALSGLSFSMRGGGPSSAPELLSASRTPLLVNLVSLTVDGTTIAHANETLSLLVRLRALEMRDVVLDRVEWIGHLLSLRRLRLLDCVVRKTEIRRSGRVSDSEDRARHAEDDGSESPYETSGDDEPDDCPDSGSEQGDTEAAGDAQGPLAETKKASGKLRMRAAAALAGALSQLEGLEELAVAGDARTHSVLSLATTDLRWLAQNSTAKRLVRLRVQCCGAGEALRTLSGSPWSRSIRALHLNSGQELCGSLPHAEPGASLPCLRRLEVETHHMSDAHAWIGRVAVFFDDQTWNVALRSVRVTATTAPLDTPPDQADSSLSSSRAARSWCAVSALTDVRRGGPRVELQLGRGQEPDVTVTTDPDRLHHVVAWRGRDAAQVAHEFCAWRERLHPKATVQSVRVELEGPLADAEALRPTDGWPVPPEVVPATSARRRVSTPREGSRVFSAQVGVLMVAPSNRRRRLRRTKPSDTSRPRCGDPRSTFPW